MCVVMFRAKSTAFLHDCIGTNMNALPKRSERLSSSFPLLVGSIRVSVSILPLNNYDGMSFSFDGMSFSFKIPTVQRHTSSAIN